MMNWNLVADSSCDLFAQDLTCDALNFATVPFSIRVGSEEIIDHEGLDIRSLVAKMEASPKATSTACPNPYDWAEQFRQAKHSLALTISANLSGSFNSACAGRDLLLAEDKNHLVHVINSRSTGPALALCLMHTAELIKTGLNPEQIFEKSQQFLDGTKTVFALCSFDNLVKNGRMSRISGFVARKLGMWGVGVASPEGTIAMKGKSRGTANVLNMILEDMQQRGFTGGEVAISHCFNPEMAQKLKESISEHWHNAKITVLKTRGLDSVYAEKGGLIISYR